MGASASDESPSRVTRIDGFLRRNECITFPLGLGNADPAPPRSCSKCFVFAGSPQPTKTLQQTLCDPRVTLFNIFRRILPTHVLMPVSWHVALCCSEVRRCLKKIHSSATDNACEDVYTRNTTRRIQKYHQKKKAPELPGDSKSSSI